MSKPTVSPISIWELINDEEIYLIKSNVEYLLEIKKHMDLDPNFYAIRSSPFGMNFANSYGSIHLPIKSVKLGTYVKF